MNRFARYNWLFALIGLLALAVPPLTRSPYYLSIGVFIALHAMVALGLGLLLGYAGQVSLGHAAFYGLGAYGSAVLTLHYHWNPWLALPGAAGRIWPGIGMSSGESQLRADQVIEQIRAESAKDGGADGDDLLAELDA